MAYDESRVDPRILGDLLGQLGRRDLLTSGEDRRVVVLADLPRAHRVRLLFAWAVHAAYPDHEMILHLWLAGLLDDP